MPRLKDTAITFRCEYFDAVDLPDHTYATMFRDNRWKLVVYHGKGVGEMYDLRERSA